MKPLIPTVRVIVHDEHKRVLLLKRAHAKHENGRWCLPGGKIAYGEKALDTCKREVQEESGLAIEHISFLFYQDDLPIEGKTDLHAMGLYFSARAHGDIKLNEESSDFIWMSEKELDQHEFAFNHKEAIKKFFTHQY